MLDTMLTAPLLAAMMLPQVARAGAVLQTQIGSLSGDAEVVLERVADLAADEAGNVYVLDSQANRVDVFSQAGEYLHGFGRRGGGPDEFNRPIRIDVHHGTVTVLNPSGQSSSYSLSGELVAAQQMPFGSQSATRLATGAYAVLSWGGIARQNPVPIESLIALNQETQDTLLTVPSTDLLFRAPTSTAALPTTLCGLAYFVSGGEERLWVASGIDGTLSEWASVDGGFVPQRSAEVAPGGVSLPDSTRTRLLEALPRQVDPQSGDLYLPPVLSSICGLERASDEILWLRVADVEGRESWREIDVGTLVGDPGVHGRSRCHDQRVLQRAGLRHPNGRHGGPLGHGLSDRMRRTVSSRQLCRVRAAQPTP